MRGHTVSLVVVAAICLVGAWVWQAGSGEADQIGEITWTASADPVAPRVGDTVRLYIRPCCFSGSPFMGQGLHVTQPEPPVFEIVGLDQTYSYWTVKALREGEASFRVNGAYEKWTCYAFPTATAGADSTPVPEPTVCGSNFHYYGSPDLTVTVGGGDGTATPVPPRGDANCDGVTTSVDAALVLQYSADLYGGGPCLYLADMDASCMIDAVDAALVLQTSARLLPLLPYEQVACPA